MTDPDDTPAPADTPPTIPLEPLVRPCEAPAPGQTFDDVIALTQEV